MIARELTRSRIALNCRGNERLAGELGLAGDEVGRISTVAIILEHEAVAGVGRLPRGQTGGVSLGLGNLRPVFRASVAVAAFLVAFRRGILRKKLGDELVVLRMRETELKERRALQVGLRGLADLFVYARQLHEKTMVFHALNYRLVRAHRVDSTADDLNDTRVAILERVLNLRFHRARRVGYRRIRSYYGFGELVSVDAESEGRASPQIEAEAELLARRIANVYGHDGDERQNEPLPYVVTNRSFL